MFINTRYEPSSVEEIAQAIRAGDLSYEEAIGVSNKFGVNLDEVDELL